VARAAEIAAEEGPRHGWSVALAERYLTRNLSYTLDPRAVEGMIRFGQLCGEANLVPAGPDIVWPDAPPPERRRRRVH